MRFARHSMLGVAVLSAVALVAVPALADPPLIQPGAPGQPNKVLTPGQSAVLGQSLPNATNTKFMQDMIMHHAQAVEMVELLKTHTDNPAMHAMGDRISISQTDEIKMMRDWLTARSETLPDVAAHHDMVMKGMLTPTQMKALAAAKGPAFDKLFLQGMIQHHQGALDMVHTVMTTPGAGEDAALFDFMSNVEADQSAEIARMQTMLAQMS